MNGDDFLDGLKTDWQSRSIDLGDVRARVKAGEQRLKSEMRQRIVHAGIMGVLFIGFAWAALALDSALFHIGSVAFLVAMLLALTDFFYLRRETGPDLLGSTNSVLARAEKQARIGMRLADAILASAVLLAVSALVAVAFALAGKANMGTSIPIAGAWLLAACCSWFHQFRARRTAQAELENVIAMRGELEGEGRAG